MANKKISELQSRTPALSDLMLVGDPSSGYSYKCTVTALATIIETDIADGYVTIGTTQTISGAKTFSNNLTLTSVVNTPTDPDKFLTLNASNVVTYRTGAEVLSDIGGVGGSGTTNYLPKFSATTTLANSQIFDNGTNVGIGVGSSIIAGYLLTIGGKVKIYNQIDLDNPTTNTCNAINIQKGTSISHRGVGYIQIASFNTNRLSLFFNDNNNYQADFDGSNLTTGQRYILPNATGTLALTSDLSSYVPTSRILTINGTSYDLSANRTWSVGTVTSVAALTLGTTGTDLSSSVANGTTTPVITLNIPTASATNRGALSSTDWSTFNNKQSTITLTTTGSSGSATFVSNTLNVPTYTLAGLGGISGTGTTNYIPKFTSSSAIGNSQIFDNGSNIGLGTNSPSASYRVTISGSTYQVGTNSKIYIDNGGVGGASAILGVVGTSYGYLNTDGGFPFVFQTNNTERMRLDASGNLFLGNTSSAVGEKLNVTGFGIAVERTDGGSTLLLGHFGGNDGIIGMYTNDNLTFRTNNTERMRLDASGNLGLGTSVPEELLELSSSNTTGGQLLMESTGLSSGNYAGMRFKIAGGSNGGYEKAGIFAIRGSGGYNDLSLIFATNTAADATNVTSANEKMRLDASGNLGINTSSPDQIGYGAGTILGILSPAADATNLQLGVVGSSGATSGNLADINFFGKNATASVVNRALFRAGIDGATNSNFFSFWTMNAGSLTEKMRLNASGNLGLGVTPSASQDAAIQSSYGLFLGDNEINITNNGYYNSGWKYIKNGYANRYSQDSYGSGHIWYTAPSGTAGNAITFTQAMTLFSTGNLAVGGTTDLGYRSQIFATTNGYTQALVQTSSFSSGNLAGTVYSGYYDATNITDMASIRGGKENTTSGNFAGMLAFYTRANGGSDTERMRITSGGALLVNTTSTTNTAAGKIVNRVAGTSNPDLLLNGGAWSIASIGGEPAIYLSSNIIAATGIPGASQTAKGGIGFEYYSSTSPTELSIGIFGTPTVASNIRFWNNGAERMRITSGGELLINTTSDAGDYKLQVNGNSYLASSSYTSGAILYLRDAVASGSNTSFAGLFLGSSPGTDYVIGKQSTNLVGTLAIKTGAGSTLLTLDASGNQELTGSIKTAAPSGGTAKPWKLGEAGVTLGGSNTSGVRVEIDGVVYYLVTGYLP
jgi:hypothetical protein